jgi:DNA-binding NarL/FixJ family response regulator
LAVRPVQVLELVSECYDNEVVANKLEIRLRTVEQHFNETYGSIKTVALLK